MADEALNRPGLHVVAPVDVTVSEGYETFEDFYRRNYTRVPGALAATLGDRELALEAADEAMSRAYPRWLEICTYTNPAGWVYRVGLNWARSLRIRLSRRLPFLEPTASEPIEPTDPQLAEALRKLPVAARAVVVCRYLLDWSVDETAEALSIAPGTVKSRLHRALRQLHVSLDNPDTPHSPTSGPIPQKDNR